ncbi:hypothetical protein V9T40_003243 [Parthenolecanium corni]|uniref:tRNA (guanine(10)-N(2))-methyltransferase TRMT11 n=1 Tax=Parthenolecanium corni TaxID=536013 RepID=A0AAN9Y9H9_9HEMI
MKNFKKYLFWFANDHVDFRLSEIESIVSLLKTTIKWKEKPTIKPYWIAELPSEDVVKEIARRSVSLKHITELWAWSSTIENLHEQVRKFSDDHLIQCPDLHQISFKFNVEVYCNTQKYSEKVSKIETFNYLPFKGRVNLNNPDITLTYIEYFGNDPNKVPEKPYHLFFGKMIAKSQRKSISDLSLKNRIFIGNTSMDAELSLIMANCAKVTDGDLVYDPFVGSGSLLVAAAYFGGYVFGVDIDYLMIHGRTKPTRKQARDKPRKNESVLANMKQYGLESHYLDVLVGDSSLPIWRPELRLDAIITDPPYGIREATEKIGTSKERQNSSSICNSETKFPSKVIYSFHQILFDLFYFSAAHLKLNGRLVTWIPVYRDDYDEDHYIPQHPCFTLISNCEQIISRVLSRRLLTFEKTKEPTAEELENFEISDSGFREKYFSYKHGRDLVSN